MKAYQNAWAVSLLAVGFVTVVISVCRIAGIEMPDALARALGVLDLLGAAVLAFTTAKLWILRRNGQDRGPDGEA